MLRSQWTDKHSTVISWWDHWSSANIDSAIGTGFYKLLSVFALLYTLLMSKLYVPTFVNHRNNSKTASVSLYFVWLSTLGKPVFVYISTIVSAINTYATQHRIVCFTSLTSFMHVGSISMVTNRPCHGPWTVNASRRFHSVSSPNVVSWLLSRKYWYHLFKATLRHRTP